MKVGDLVVLKCGGPVMIVAEVTAASPVRCMWFSTRNEKQEGYFQSEILESLDHMVCSACGSKIEPLEQPEAEPRVFLGSKRRKR